MKRSITVWVLAVSLLHVLVGCGGDDEASDDGATTGDTTAGADAGDTSAGADAGDTSGSEDTGATADTGGGGDAGTTPADTGGQAEADFTEVFAMVFEAEGCTGGYCHGSGQGGLMLSDAATTHGNLVNVDAANPMCDLTKLVVPGEPEQSILWMRVRPAAQDEGSPCAPKMPAGSDGLDAAEAQLIYDWIAAGAPAAE